MRRFLPLLLLPFLGQPALAADHPKADATSAHHHARQTWKEHFTKANVAHDGHLTLQEAKDGYPPVAKHFAEIDADHKGYVTENDLKAWHIKRRAAHRHSKHSTDHAKAKDAMQPGPAAEGSGTAQATQPPVARATQPVLTPSAATPARADEAAND